MKSEHTKTGLLIALFVGILIALILVLKPFGEERLINNWLHERGLHAIFKEQRFIRTGPFWASDDDTVYFVKATKGAEFDGKVEIYWFKFGFGMNVAPGRPEDYRDNL